MMKTKHGMLREWSGKSAPRKLHPIRDLEDEERPRPRGDTGGRDAWDRRDPTRALK